MQILMIIGYLNFSFIVSSSIASSTAIVYHFEVSWYII